MTNLMRTFSAVMICGLVCAPIRAQEAAATPVRTSPVQRLIAVDKLVEDKEYEDAIRGYNELLAEDPNNAQILNRIGNAYQALQKMRDAKSYYERALKADPTFAAAANNIGCVYYNQKRYGRAAREYRKAIKMDSSVASFHSNLGYAYLQEKKYKEMMMAFHEAVTLDPTIFDQHNRSGAIVLERSVEDRGAFYFYLAKTYGEMGDIERCLEYLKKARDEHYKDILAVKTDPAFAPVRPKPAMKEFIDTLTPAPTPNPSSAL
ncbi:MAG TPA: tetratricopeptide repeat protein [Candidatus Acidoferrales bacterium]|nr:tetratricopeptide repeat protein [Candidatus Acidoferrales bacterium]